MKKLARLVILPLVLQLAACAKEDASPVTANPTSIQPVTSAGIVSAGAASSATPSESASATPSAASGGTASPAKAVSAAPTSSPDIASNATVKRYKDKGYQVEEKQVFTREFEGIGRRTVIPVTKFGLEKEFPVSLIVTGGDKDVVLTPKREEGFPMFSSFEAISFKDIDPDSLKSGYSDIVVIANFITGAGQQGAEPFSDVFVFKNDSWGEFVEDTALEERILRTTDQRTLTMKEVYAFAKPVEWKNFIGSFKRLPESKYSGSVIEIKRIEGHKVYFKLDAFHVNGGEKGVKEGNVNVGNIEDGVAVIDGNKAVYTSTIVDFKMTFEFFANDTFLITEEGPSEFGMNVSAEGRYAKK